MRLPPEIETRMREEKAEAERRYRVDHADDIAAIRKTQGYTK